MNNYIKYIVEDFDFNKVNNNTNASDNVMNTIKNDILDYVDMGLPSGTLWCKYNAGVDVEFAKREYKLYWGSIGATIYPRNHWIGLLCGWGETFPNVHALVNYETNGVKNQFNWHDYKYTQSDDYEIEDSKLSHRLTKYCSKRFYGKDFFKDNLRVLEPKDDEAAQDALKWKYPYDVKLPTSKDYLELLRYTSKQFVYDYQNVKELDGLLLKSTTNGAELFFPFSGLMAGPFHQEEYQAGHYWCSDLFVEDPTLAYSFNFGTFDHVEDKILKSSIPTTNNKKDRYHNDEGVIIAYERYRGMAIRGIVA